MTRRLLLLLALGGCAVNPTPEQIRAQCEAERTRRGIRRLLPPETRDRPECQPPSAAPN